MQIGFEVVAEAAQLRFGLHARFDGLAFLHYALRAFLIVPEFRFCGECIQFNQAGSIFGNLKDTSARARCGTSARSNAALDLRFVRQTFSYYPRRIIAAVHANRRLTFVLPRGVSHDYKSEAR